MRKPVKSSTVNLGYYLIALGANLTTPREAVIDAVRRIVADPDLSVRAVSRFMTSPAHPPGSGPDFVNAAMVLTSQLDPDVLLERLHGIEAAMGRQREGAGRWAPRPIDLDLLAADQIVRPNAAIQTTWRNLPEVDQRSIAPSELILPHPRIQDRIFVLKPLSEIAPKWRHPLTGKTVADMLATLVSA